MLDHKLVLSLLLVIFLLAACQEEIPAPTATPESTPTETAVSPTEEPASE